MTGPAIWVIYMTHIYPYGFLFLFIIVLLLLSTSVVVIFGEECFPCPRLFRGAHEKY